MINNFIYMFNSIANKLDKYRKFIFILLTIVILILPFTGINGYYLRIIIMICIYSILALGLNLVTGYAGQVSLGNAAFYAIGAYTSAILSTRFGINFFIAIVCAGLVSAIFGFLIGLPSLRLSGTYLAITTLGFGEVIRIFLLNFDKLTNGPLGISRIPKPSLFGFELTLVNNGLYFLVLILLTIILLACYFIINSKIGRAFIAIKEDELAASLMGIKTTVNKVLSFILSALFSGIAGSFYAHMTSYIDPNTFVFDTSIMILSIVILGGMGTLKGMIIGAIILVSFPELLRFVDRFRFIVYGIILVCMMRFRPQGIMGGQVKKPYKLPNSL